MYLLCKWSFNAFEYQTLVLCRQWNCQSLSHRYPECNKDVSCMQYLLRHLCEGCSRWLYSGPCILRPPLQTEKCGLKLEVVLNRRDIYTENIRMASQMAGLIMKGIVGWKGLKLQGPLYCLNLFTRYVYVFRKYNWPRIVATYVFSVFIEGLIILQRFKGDTQIAIELCVVFVLHWNSCILKWLLKPPISLCLAVKALQSEMPKLINWY